MVWAKLDDEILDNPKIAKAGVLGFAMHVAGITWSCRNLRNGFVPESAVRRLLDLSEVIYEYASLMGGPSAIADGLTESMYGIPPVIGDNVAALLVDCGLWEKVDGGYVIHDFLVYNPSRDEVLAVRNVLKEKRSAAGKKGASKRWGASKGVSSDADGKIANGIANTMAKPWQTDGPVPVPLKELPLAGARVAIAEPERTIQHTDEITPQLIETAKLERVQDIAGAWKKFTGHYAGKWHHVAGKWQQWCVREAKDERTARDKAKYPPRDGPADPGDQYHSPSVVAARKRRDAERREESATATRAPVALAAIVGGAPEPKSETRVAAAPAAKEIQIRQPLTDAEREAKRVESLLAIASFDDGSKAAGGEK